MGPGYGQGGSSQPAVEQWREGERPVRHPVRPRQRTQEAGPPSGGRSAASPAKGRHTGPLVPAPGRP